jgi:lysophospholipase L1-like esterase
MTITALLLGSSTIENWKHFHIPNQPQRNIIKNINRGIRGLTTSELFSNQYTNHITKGIRQDPTYIIFYCGINDIFDKVGNRIIVTNLRMFLEQLIGLFPKSKIVFISLIKSPKTYIEKKNSDIDYVNNHMRVVCSGLGNQIQYVNVNRGLSDRHFMDDHFHLNATGYEKILEKLVGVIS